LRSSDRVSLEPGRCGGLPRSTGNHGLFGTTAHQPSQNLLQNARMRTGRMVKRRITLHGLAWRSHVALFIAKIRATFRSRVIIYPSSNPQDHYLFL
jgi:hypothetical protein